MLIDYLMEQGFQKQREVARLASYRKDRPFSEGEGTSEGMEESWRHCRFIPTDFDLANDPLRLRV